MGKTKQPASAAGTIRIHATSNAKGQTEIDLSHHSLTYIPLQVFQFAHLEVLKLSNNTIDTVPVMISYLRGLRTLDLQHNLLTQLPETLVNCRHLSEIDLTHNQMTTLPRGLGTLKELRVLKLGDNLLEQVPHEIGDITSLRVLDLHGNHLWYLPFSAQNLHHLVRLDLSNNLFDQIPLVVTKMPWLHALNMAKNRLAALPPDFDQLRALQELNLSENQFVAMGMMVAKLRNLKYLSLAHNRLKFLPKQMTSLQNLRVLHLQGNALESLPDDFPHLRYLNIARNSLVQFSVLHMAHLAALDASSNKLLTVPHGLYHLYQLRILRLAHNNISELAEEICQLKKLQTLDISDNNLCSLPASLHFMSKLTSFNMHGNENISRPHLLAVSGFITPGYKSLHSKTTSLNKKQKSKDKNMLMRKSFSMPSLHKPMLSDQNIAYATLTDKSAGLPSTNGYNRSGVIPQPAWLQQKAPWVKDMTLHTAPSILYPVDTTDFDTAEIQTNLSAESLDSDSTSSTFHIPFSKQSFTSKLTDLAREACLCSDDENDNPRQSKDPVSGPQHAAMSRTPKKKSLRDLFCMTTNQNADTATPSAARNDANNMADSFLETKNLSQNVLPLTSKHPISECEGCHDIFYQPSKSEMNYISTYMSAGNSFKATQGTGQTFSTSLQSQRFQAPVKDNKMINNASHLYVQTRQQPEDGSTEQPLTMQMWTQTQPFTESVMSTSTQTQLVLDSIQSPVKENTIENHSAMSPPHPAAGHHGNFIMRKRHPTPLSPLSPSSQPNWSATSGIQSSSETTPYPSSGPKTGSHSHEGAKQGKGIDYTLLGMCSQIQTKLHKDLLQPVIGFSGGHSGRFSDKTTSKESDGMWLTHHAGGELLADGVMEGGLEYSPGETFTTTGDGGHYMSIFCPHVQVSVPPGAISSILHVTLQQLTISPALLEALGHINSHISNIIALGPIIFLSALENTAFTSPVTMTIPSPPKAKSQQGHLVVVSICNDNTCIPCATGYQSSRHEVTLTSWHITGKVAMQMKAKCKYKACKSMEQLLATLNLVTMNTTGHG